MIDSCASDDDELTSLSELLLNFAHPVGSYNAGATGGSVTVKLTASQMPSHTHKISGKSASAGAHTHKIKCDLDAYYTKSGTRSWSVHQAETGAGSTVGITDSKGSHTHSISLTSASAGNGGAHENMPPYIAAYCWRRTA